jgi:hypothetical protein
MMRKDVSRLGLFTVATVLFTGILVGCQWAPWATQDAENEPAFESGGFGIRTLTGSATASSIEALNVEATPNAMEFRSSDISFWALETPEDIDRAYSNPTDEIDNPILALQYDMGNVTIRFQDGEALEVNAGVVPEFELGRRYNMIRVDIGAGSLSLYVDDTDVEHLYDADGTELVVRDAEAVDTGLNANSVVLVDEDWVETPFFISRDEYESFEPTAYASYGLTESEAKIYDRILKRSDSNGGGLDLSGALFLPFTPQDFSTYEELESVVVEFVWSISEAFEPYLDGYRMLDTTGTGISLDFKVRLRVNE